MSGFIVIQVKSNIVTLYRPQFESRKTANKRKQAKLLCSSFHCRWLYRADCLTFSSKHNILHLSKHNALIGTIYSSKKVFELRTLKWNLAPKSRHKLPPGCQNVYSQPILLHLLAFDDCIEYSVFQ